VSVIVIARFSVSDVHKAAKWARTHADVTRRHHGLWQELGSNRTPDVHRRQGSDRDRRVTGRRYLQYILRWCQENGRVPQRRRHRRRPRGDDPRSAGCARHVLISQARTAPISGWTPCPRTPGRGAAMRNRGLLVYSRPAGHPVASNTATGSR